MSAHTRVAVGSGWSRCSSIIAAPPLCALLLVSALFVSGRASGDSQKVPGPLFGVRAVEERPPPNLDPLLPTGSTELRTSSSAQPPTEPPACSFRMPVCVQIVSDADAHAALALLTELELAYRKLVHVLGLPSPSSVDSLMWGRDWSGTGQAPLVFELAEDPRQPLELVNVERSLGQDQARARCVAGARADELARLATLCVGEAIALQLDAAETPNVRRAFATELWWQSGHPENQDLQAIDDFQANPQASPLARERTRLSGGSALVFEQLSRRLAREENANLAGAVLALSRGASPADSPQWNNEPDLADVIRRAFDDSPDGIARFWVDFAVRRAFLGSRDDGTHWPRLAWASNFGRVRFDWSIKLSSLPRRLAPLRPIDPLGAMYVWLDLDEDVSATTLAIEAEWEKPVSFKWQLVRIDADGRERGRIDLPYLRGSTKVQRTVVNFQDTRALLVVGTNIGGVDASHPFDPDYEPHEPHGCTVYLTKL